MGDSIELDEALAEELQAEARERGFADGDAYLSWLVQNRDCLFRTAAIADRLEDIEHRLADIEAAIPLEEQARDDFWDEDVTDAIDDALGEPTGAHDSDVASAISDIEDD